MPFKPDDPILANICKESATILFAPLLSDHKLTSMHHVYCLPAITRRPYVVKFSIGSRVRTLGFFSIRENACRFADMVTLRFWKYRRRNTPQRFNYTEAQAIADTNGNPEAAYILAQVETHLSVHLTEYSIRTPIVRKKKLSWEEKTATLRNEIANLEVRIAALESKQQSTPTIFDGFDSPKTFDSIETPKTTQPVNIWQQKSTNEQ